MAATKASKTPVKKESNKGSKKSRTKDSGDFPLIRHRDITLPPRPSEGDDATTEFFNPRPLEEVLVPEKINKLVNSIRLDGVIENPVVNFVSDPDSDEPLRIELLAGERRYHALKRIIDENLPCVDDKSAKPKLFNVGDIVNCTSRFGEVISHTNNIVRIKFTDDTVNPPTSEEIDCNYVDVFPTKGGAEVHEFIRCKVYHDLPNDRKMRVSFSENDNSEPLSVKAEIALVERYLKSGKMKQKEVAYMLNTNITFVSQRAAFRTELPKAAFQKLMDGKMTAHLAVNMLSFKGEHRDKYFQKMEEVEKFESANNIRKHKAAQEQHEDEADAHEHAAKKAEKVGDTATAAKERKKAATANAKAKKSKARKERAEAEQGHIKQGHAQKAAVDLGITPRTAKMLAKEQVEDLYIKRMAKFVTGDEVDPITGHVIPAAMAAMIRRTAKGIVDGALDPLQIVREYMVETGEWELSKETSASGPKPKHKPNREDDEDEDDEGAERFSVEDDDDDDFDDEESGRYGQDDDDDDDEDEDEDEDDFFVSDDDKDFSDDDQDWGNSDAFDREWN